MYMETIRQVYGLSRALDEFELRAVSERIPSLCCPFKIGLCLLDITKMDNHALA